MRPGRLPRSLAPIINAHSRKGKRGRGGGAKAREVVGGKEGDGGGRRPVGPETFFSCRGQALSACKVQRVGLGEPLHLVLDPRVPSSSPFSFFYLCIPPLLSFSLSLFSLFSFSFLSLFLFLFLLDKGRSGTGRARSLSIMRFNRVTDTLSLRFLTSNIGAGNRSMDYRRGQVEVKTADCRF